MLSQPGHILLQLHQRLCVTPQNTLVVSGQESLQSTWGTCGLSALVREPSAFSCTLVVWELFELTAVATAALGKHLVRDEGKHTL